MGGGETVLGKNELGQRKEGGRGQKTGKGIS